MERILDPVCLRFSCRAKKTSNCGLQRSCPKRNNRTIRKFIVQFEEDSLIQAKEQNLILIQTVTLMTLMKQRLVCTLQIYNWSAEQE